MSKTQPKNKSKYNSYVRYSNLALQMGVIIAGGTFAGHWMDGFCGWKFPLFTLLFSLVSVFTAIYLAVKDLMKPNKS